MKAILSLLSWLSLFWILGSSQANSIDNNKNLLRRGLQDNDNYTPFPNATPVRHKYKDGWFFGNITDFDSAAQKYTLSWSDGDIEDYTDLAQVAEKVAAAADDYEAYSVATAETVTPVRFPYKDGWMFGNITAWNASDRSYEIHWDDETSKTYFNLEHMDDKVRAATSHYKAYPIPTAVRFEYEDDGWMMGNITSWNEEDRTYELTWSDGHSKTYHNIAHMDDKVRAAHDNYQPHPIPTPVRFPYKDGWMFGNITAWSAADRSYEIHWDDDISKTYFNLEHMDDKVRAADTLYEPYSIPTAVRFKYAEYGWMFGNITAYNEADRSYELSWADGHSKTYHNIAHMDDKVRAADPEAHYQPHPIPTPVRFQYDDGWMFGNITAWNMDDKTYEISWADESSKTYHNLVHMDDKVRAAHTQYIPYPTETLVRFQYSNGWFFGHILSYQEPDQSYQITWSDGSNKAYFNLVHMDDKVRAAHVQYQPHAVGTEVRKQFPDSGEWFFGEVSSAFDATTRSYQILWADGDTITYDDLMEMDTMVHHAANYEPYLIGTEVRETIEEIPILGEISAYDQNTQTYTIDWSVGTSRTSKTYTDLKGVDIKVHDAMSGSAWPVGTPVREKRQGKSAWTWGIISAYDEDTKIYKIQWSDDTITEHTEHSEVNAMVRSANLFVPHLVGTPVRTQVDDDSQFPTLWHTGFITSYDEGDKSYVVTWSENNGVEQTIHDSDFIDTIVSNASDKYTPYDEGIKVYRNFGSDGWYWGTIQLYLPSSQSYRIEWSDKTMETVSDLSQVDQMVRQAVSQTKDSGSVAGKTNDENTSATTPTSTSTTKESNPRRGGYIAIAFVVTLGAVVFFYELSVRRRRRARTEHVLQGQVSTPSKFRDTVEVSSDSDPVLPEFA